MLWKVGMPDGKQATATPWEPIELRTLKKRLQELSCECKSCAKNHASMCYQTETGTWRKDQEIQVDKETPNKSAHLLTSSHTITEDHYLLSNTTSEFGHHQFCPNCVMTMQILRGGVTKVVKDQGVETKAGMFTRDKATEKSLECIEKTTSLTARPVLKYSNLVYCDSQLTSSDSLAPNPSPHRDLPGVTFAFRNDYYSDEDLYDKQRKALPCSPLADTENSSPEPEFHTLSSTEEVFIDSYIDAIRPPWSEISPTGEW